MTPLGSLLIDALLRPVAESEDAATFEKGDYVTKITVGFDKAGYPVWVDVRPEKKIDPIDEQLNQLQLKLKEFVEKENWDAVAEVADQLAALKGDLMRARK